MHFFRRFSDPPPPYSPVPSNQNDNPAIPAPPYQQEPDSRHPPLFSASILSSTPLPFPVFAPANTTLRSSGRLTVLHVPDRIHPDPAAPVETAEYSEESYRPRPQLARRETNHFETNSGTLRRQVMGSRSHHVRLPRNVSGIVPGSWPVDTEAGIDQLLRHPMLLADEAAARRREERLRNSHLLPRPAPEGSGVELIWGSGDTSDDESESNSISPHSETSGDDVSNDSEEMITEYHVFLPDDDVLATPGAEVPLPLPSYQLSWADDVELSLSNVPSLTSSASSESASGYTQANEHPDSYAISEDLGNYTDEDQNSLHSLSTGRSEATDGRVSAPADYLGISVVSAEAASQHGQLISSLGGLFFDVPLEESAHLPPTPPSTLNSSYSPPPTPVLESSDPFSPDEVDFYSALPPAFTAEDLPAEFSTEEGPRSPVELLNLSDMSARNTRNRHYQLHERFGYMPTIDEVLTGNAPSNDQPRARIRFREPWPPIHCITELNPMSPAETSDANADDLEEMGEAQPEPISDEEVVEETATTATFVRAMGSSMVDGTSDTQPTNAAVHKAVLVEVRPGRHIRPNPENHTVTTTVTHSVEEQRNLPSTSDIIQEQLAVQEQHVVTSTTINVDEDKITGVTNPAVTEIKPTTTKTSTDSTGTGPISIPTLREILRAIRNGNISQRDEAERWWNVLLDMRREKRRRFSIRRTIKIKLVEKLLRSYEQKHEDENSQD